MKRIKIDTGRYYLRQIVIAQDPTQSYWRNVATATKTGTRRDNYPWNWELLEGLSFGTKEGKTARPYGTAESLKAAIDTIQGRISTYGLLGEMEMEK